MELRKLNPADARAQWEFTTAQPENENGLTNPHHGVSFEDYINDVLPLLLSYEHPTDMPDWFVPETYYYLWVSGRIVGEFRLRHYLTETLRNGAGHIGYGIRKEERSKGYATAGLRLLLPIARQVVPEDEIYLRAMKDNLASQKVMRNCGAYLACQTETHVFLRIPK